MLDNMIQVMNRVNEIKTRFGLKRHNPAAQPLQKTTNPVADFKSTLADQLIKQNTPVEQKPLPNIQGPQTRRTLAPDDIKVLAGQYAIKNGVPPALVNAVIEVESGFNPAAVSPKGAMGLMQLMPALARELGVGDPMIPELNIQGGVTHLRRLLGKYGWDYSKALAAYNAGETAVDNSPNGIPYEETRNYVKRVIDAYTQNSK